MSQRNVILGMCDRLAHEDVAVFVESLAQTTYSGDVVIFVRDIEQRTRLLLGRRGVETVPYHRLEVHVRGRVLRPYDRRFQRIQPAYMPVIRAMSLASRDRLRTSARFAELLTVPYVARYFAFYSYLSGRDGRYNNVMLTDVRDVYFQTDPFACGLGRGVHCFLEDARFTLNSEPVNRDWLVSAYGEHVLTDIGARPISCSGVTIGDDRAILEYLRVMVRALLSLGRHIEGIDQAVHNVLLHRRLIPGARTFRNGAGPVATLALVPPEELKRYLGAPVLHQYDRHPQLAEMLRRRVHCSDARIGSSTLS